MYERLKRLYKTGMVTAPMLEKAVLRHWITEEQKNAIINGVGDAPQEPSPQEGL